MEEIWLSPDTLAKVRKGALPELLAAQSTTSDLFDLDAPTQPRSSDGPPVFVTVR
jgi:RHH-type rel operon transcriptional repressor/antitoxin RelB